MILDSQNLFSDGQSVTANAASTNVIDLGDTGTPYKGNKLTRDIGPGTPIELLIQLVADATGTSPTLQVDVEVDDNEGFASPTVVSSQSFTGGSTGDRLPFRFVPDGVNQRYVRLNYTVGGTSPVYAVTAGVVAGVQTNR